MPDKLTQANATGTTELSPKRLTISQIKDRRAVNICALAASFAIATDPFHKNITAAASTLKAYGDGEQVYRAQAYDGMTLWATVNGAPRLVDAIDAIPDRSADPDTFASEAREPLRFPVDHPGNCPCRICIAERVEPIQRATKEAFARFVDNLTAVADCATETQKPAPGSQLAARIETYRSIAAMINANLETGMLWEGNKVTIFVTTCDECGYSVAGPHFYASCPNCHTAPVSCVVDSGDPFPDHAPRSDEDRQHTRELYTN